MSTYKRPFGGLLSLEDLLTPSIYRMANIGKEINLGLFLSRMDSDDILSPEESGSILSILAPDLELTEILGFGQV